MSDVVGLGCSVTACRKGEKITHPVSRYIARLVIELESQLKDFFKGERSVPLLPIRILDLLQGGRFSDTCLQHGHYCNVNSVPFFQRCWSELFVHDIVSHEVGNGEVFLPLPGAFALWL